MNIIDILFVVVMTFLLLFICNKAYDNNRSYPLSEYSAGDIVVIKIDKKTGMLLHRYSKDEWSIRLPSEKSYYIRVFYEYEFELKDKDER